MPTRDPWRGLRGSFLLRSLPPQNALLLAPSLRRASHKVGNRLTPGETDLIYFPETLVVCVVGDGRDSAVGMIGREGLVGWDRLFNCAARDRQIFVALNDGDTLVIPGDRLRALMLAHPSLAVSLIPFLQTYVEQMGRTILSTLHDSLQARLSAWLLMMHERVEGNELAITHSALATFLNVRRASVTETMHVLEGERALSCSRGRITVLDPAALRNRAGLVPSRPQQHTLTIVPAAPSPGARRPTAFERREANGRAALA